jgi:hypothetical protein
LCHSGVEEIVSDYFFHTFMPDIFQPLGLRAKTTAHLAVPFNRLDIVQKQPMYIFIFFLANKSLKQ